MVGSIHNKKLKPNVLNATLENNKTENYTNKIFIYK